MSVLATGRGLVTGRIALLLPDQEAFLGGPPASRLCTTVEEIGDHLENALRLQVLGLGLRVQAQQQNNCGMFQLHPPSRKLAATWRGRCVCKC